MSEIHAGCTSFTWEPGGKPICQNCGSVLSVYMVIVNGFPHRQGTFCPGCDEYDDVMQHLTNWNARLLRTFNKDDKVSVMMPVTEDEWSAAREFFVSGNGVRETRCAR